MEGKVVYTSSELIEAGENKTASAKRPNCNRVPTLLVNIKQPLWQTHWRFQKQPHGRFQQCLLWEEVRIDYISKPELAIQRELELHRDPQLQSGSQLLNSRNVSFNDFPASWKTIATWTISGSLIGDSYGSLMDDEDLGNIDCECLQLEKEKTFVIGIHFFNSRKFTFFLLPCPSSSRF